MKMRGILLIFSMLILASGDTFASHVSGAEISYKHLFGNTYQFKLIVYRDCRECKFNNTGGGDNSTNCNEVPPLVIKGALGTTYSSLTLGNIDLNRVQINDLTKVCYGTRSKCRPGSNLPLGYEEHVFEGNFDFGQLLNEGKCKFDVSISLSSRSTNVNQSMSEQNFFNYAMVNLCEGQVNESVEFKNKPQFIHFINQSNFHALSPYNPDKDSLVFYLKPALVNRNMSLTYALGKGSDRPFSYYCTGIQPCQANINGSLVEGFYINRNNGDYAFTPTQVNEGGVIVIECEEWKKNSSGNYYLAGITRRDIYGDVINESNNLPRIKNLFYDFTLCENEHLDLEIAVEDLPWLNQANDSVFLSLNQEFYGVTLEKLPINAAPYFKYYLRIDAAQLKPGKYPITISARDNHCSLSGMSSKTFNVEVLKSRSFDIKTAVKNCGNLEVSCSNFNNRNIYWTVLDINQNILKQQFSKKINMQLPQGGKYIIKSFLPAENGYCQISQIDTVTVEPFLKPILHLGNDVKVCSRKEVLIEPIEFKTFDSYNLYVDGKLISGFPYQHQANETKSFTFRVVQNNGCQVEDQIQVDVHPLLSYQIKNDSVCTNGVFPMPVRNVQVDPNKINMIDFTYKSMWSNLEQVNPKNWQIEQIAPQAHQVTLYSIIQDKNACLYVDTSYIQFIEPQEIKVNCQEQICINAQAVNLQTNPGGQWECVNYPQFVKNNILTVNSRAFDNLLLKYTEKQFCSNTKTFVIQALDTTPVDFAHQKDLILCENSGLFKLQGLPQGGLWTGLYIENEQFNPAQAGGKTQRLIYEYRNASGCKSTAPVSIFVEKLPALQVSASKPAVCVGDLLELQALSSIQTGGYWYTDGAGSFTQPVSASTVYQPSPSDVEKGLITFTYTIQTNGVCGNVDADIYVRVKKGPTGDILKTYPDALCEPATLTFRTDFQKLEKQYWFINDSLSEEYDYNFPFKAVLKAGNYVIKTKVYDSTCEALAISKTIQVHPVPQMKMLSNPAFKISREYPRIYLKDQSYARNGHTVSWYFNETYIGNSRELYYRADDSRDSFYIKLVAVSDLGGCKDSLSQLFVFIPINQLYIPDAFSPDTKGPDKNNVFKVEGPAMAYFELEIYNRFGEKVFYSKNMNEAWDGTYKNEMCMNGTYFYKIISTDYEGISRDYSGTLILIR